jgi:hypothetical protein
MASAWRQTECVRIFSFAIMATAWICVGQQRPPEKQVDSPLLDKRKPTAYVSFNRYDDERKEAWLNIVNNTKWGISSAGLPFALDSGWCYRVVTDDGCRTPIYPPLGNCSDVIGVTGAQAGRSTRLVVAAEGLSRGLAIEIHISYEWEPAAGVRHTVWFGHSDLPEVVRSVLPFDWSIHRPITDCNEPPAHGPPEVAIPAPPVAPTLDSILPNLTKPQLPAPPSRKKD